MFLPRLCGQQWRTTFEQAMSQGFLKGFSMSVACRPVYFMRHGLSPEVIGKAVLVRRGAQEHRYAGHRCASLSFFLQVGITKR